MTSEDDIKALVEHTETTHGGLDIAFNNAGVEGDAGTIVGDTVENYNFIFDINVRGVWLSMKHQIPVMLERGGGSIINTSSIAGLIGFPEHGLYVASKHAVLGLTKTAALEYGSQGVRVNAELRGAGVGTALVEHALGLARERACCLVQLTTDKSRPDALRFYEALGFRASHEGLKLKLDD